MSRSSRYSRSVLLVAAGLASSACATMSATQTRLRDSSPTVREYEDLCAEVGGEDREGAVDVRRGGCPVCSW